MLYAAPRLTPAQTEALTTLEEHRRVLAFHIRRPQRWTGVLRRLAQAEVASASTTIEGFVTTPEEALEIIQGRRPQGVREEDVEAVRGYQMAMDRVLSWADYPNFRWSEEIISELHFLVSHAHRPSQPGLYRTAGVWITGRDGQVQYEGAQAKEVPKLVRELATWLAEGDLDRPALIRAAMAHLNLISIHPFADGNGRTSRVLQSLVLAREGVLIPELASIEEYLGRQAEEYYRALRTCGDHYDPSRDASQWIDFCLSAHLREAQRLDERIRLMYARNTFCERLAEAGGYDERLIGLMEDALLAIPIRNEDYRTREGIAAQTAWADLQVLVRDGWLIQQGSGRSSRYVASARLQEEWREEYRRNGLPPLGA